MRALTLRPGKRDSIRLEDIDKPDPQGTHLLVRTLAMGVCGTDHELIDGGYGWPPPGSERLVIGHESLGRVEWAPPDSGFVAGDSVVGIVRRPDPVPCSSCAVGEWDMCRNGRYTEHGIKEVNGFGAEWFAVERGGAVKVDPLLGTLGVLLEPTSVVAKAWDQIERISKRSQCSPRTALVTGAGPVGLLAALLGTQRGLAMHVLDRNETGLKPDLVRALGATYHSQGISKLDFDPDIVLECTGAVSVIAAILQCIPPCGIVCLLGVSAPGAKSSFDIGAFNRDLVLENEVIFGSVNANRRHYELAAAALAAADRQWLDRLITRRVPLDRWQEAFERREDDVKTIIEFEQ